MEKSKTKESGQNRISDGKTKNYINTPLKKGLKKRKTVKGSHTMSSVLARKNTTRTCPEAVDDLTIADSKNSDATGEFDKIIQVNIDMKVEFSFSLWKPGGKIFHYNEKHHLVDASILRSFFLALGIDEHIEWDNLIQP